MAINYSTVITVDDLIIPLIAEYLGCFQFLIITNNTAKTVLLNIPCFSNS